MSSTKSVDYILFHIGESITNSSIALNPIEVVDQLLTSLVSFTMIRARAWPFEMFIYLKLFFRCVNKYLLCIIFWEKRGTRFVFLYGICINKL